VTQSPTATSRPVSGGDLTVHFLDVGQGDSILIQLNGKNMLIDAGESNMGNRVVSYLKDQGVAKLDVVVATHAHTDHIGGMASVLNTFPVGRFVDSGNPHTSQTYENMLILIEQKNIPFTVAGRGQSVTLDPALSIQVLNPGSVLLDDLNEDSVVLKLTHGQVSFLLTGDAGVEAEKNMISANTDLDSDILKVGHHGSRYSSSSQFLSRVSPEVSIIQVGSGNSYGHPTTETLSALQNTGSTIYRTDTHGHIIITSDGVAYTIKTQIAGTSPYTTVTVPTTMWTTAVTTAPTVAPTAVRTTATGSVSSSVTVSDLNLKDEWVKIRNTGSSSVSLSGWKMVDDGNKHTYTFGSFTLSPGSTVVLHTGKGTNTATDLYWGSGSPIWNNDGDVASLYDASGRLVDTLER